MGAQRAALAAGDVHALRAAVERDVLRWVVRGQDANGSQRAGIVQGESPLGAGADPDLVAVGREGGVVGEVARRKRA